MVVDGGELTDRGRAGVESLVGPEGVGVDNYCGGGFDWVRKTVMLETPGGI